MLRPTRTVRAERGSCKKSPIRGMAARRSRGNGFRLALPIVHGKPHASQPHGPAAMSRILVIDDEDVIRMLVGEILDSAGHDVTSAESAETALALLDEADFDLVVSDVVMPGLSGIELLETVRARRASLPVVLV